MALGAQVVARKGKPPRITYRWDPETDILTGSVRGRPHEPKDGGLTGSVELEGTDGSFVLLDVAGGVIRGVEVVVWPDVRTVAALQPPADASEGDVVLPTRTAAGAVTAVEVDTPLNIDTNADESVFRVRVGAARRVEAVRVADGLVVEVDERQEIAGLWLVGVPPFPADEPAL